MAGFGGYGGDVGVGFGAQARNSVSRGRRPVRMDGGVRSGPRHASTAAAAQGAMRQAGDAAEEASRSARYRDAMSAEPAQDGVGAAPDPYAGAGEQGSGSAKPGVLGGGSMGLKPDLSEVESLEKQYAESLDRRPAWMAGFRGVGDVFRAKDESFQTRIAMAKEKAFRDAAQARAANEWVDDDVIESGQIQQTNPLTGKRRLKTVEEQYKEEIKGPRQPGAETPYRDAMRQAPVFDKNLAERRMMGRQEQEKISSEEGSRRRLTAEEIEAKRLAEEKLAGTKHGYEMTERQFTEGQANVRQRNALNAGQYAPREARDPYATPQGENTLLDTESLRIIRGMGFPDAADYSANATAEQRAAYAKAFTEAASAGGRPRGSNQLPLGPGATSDYGGPVGPPLSSGPSDGAKRKNVRQGQNVTEQWSAKKGKWVVVAVEGR